MLSSHYMGHNCRSGQFRRSLYLARRQGALSWELGTAISLTRLRRDQGCIAEVRELPASVYGRFPGWHGTAHLQTAKCLLDELTGLPTVE